MAALVCLVVVTQTGLMAARPLVSYRTIALGGGGLAVGVAASAFAVLSVLVAMPLGRWTDRTGRTPRLLSAGTVLCIGSAAALAVAPTLALVAAASALLGFAHVLLMVGAQNHVARLSADSALDRNFGYLTAAVAGGQLLGPLLAGLALGGSGSVTLGATARASWYAAAVVVVALPVVVAVWRLSPRPDGHPVRTGEELPARLSTRDLARRPGVPTGLLASMALLSAVDLLTAYLPLVAEERGIAPATVGVLLALRAAASLVSRIGLGALAARFGRRSLIVASTLGSAAALAVVALPLPGVLWMALALVVGGLLLGIGQPLTMTGMVRAVPPNARGAVLALRLVVNRVGQVALPLGAGAAAGGLGAAAALWFAGGVLAVAGAASLRARW
jgi:predicted MFS family arabinose efflux permease